MQRRAVLLTLAGLAGCSGSAGDSSSETPTAATPDSSASPRRYLPSAPDGWQQTRVEELNVGFIEAEAGYRGTYQTGGDEYVVEILRWGSSGPNWPDGESTYDSWPIRLIRGRFEIGAKGASESKSVMLLGRSSILSPTYITENDLNQ